MENLTTTRQRELMRPQNILFVDDNELLRSVMLRYFAKEFQHVIAVGTGNEAMKQVQEEFYHIVVLDKQLPDIDGLDVLDYIRVKSPRSRVVMITSNTDASVRQEAFNRGAFEFFEKPFNIDNLRTICRDLRICKKLHARINEKHVCMTHDLSASGILVNTDAVFQCGASVDILLQTADNQAIPLKGTVVRTADSACISPLSVAAEDIMRYAVGIQLVAPPSDYSTFVYSLLP